MLKISYKALLNKIKDYEIEDRYRELARGQTTEDRGRMTAGSGQLAAGSRYDS
jgi:hypothetical protein